MINKKSIYKILENLTEPGAGKNLVAGEHIKNIVVFEKEIIVDILMQNPTFQAKKKMENKIIKALKNHFPESEIKVNITIKPSEKKTITAAKKLEGVANIIAIASGKGGVGKSTITANLAVNLQNMGFKVGILDADVYGPSIHMMLDVQNEKPLTINIQGKNKIKPIENYGIQLLSLGFFTNPNQAVIWRGPMAAKALNQMIFDAHWDNLDFLLIDLPPGTGDVHLSIVQAVPITGAVIVSTPQNIALADAKKGIAMFEQENIKVPVLGIIENMSYFASEENPDKKHYIFGKEGAKHLAEDLKTSFLGAIPLVQSIREASDFGRPAALQKNSFLSKIFEEISKKTLESLIKRNEKLPKTEIVKITTMSGCSK